VPSVLLVLFAFVATQVLGAAAGELAFRAWRRRDDRRGQTR